MTIYDTLTHKKVKYFLIDAFQPTDTICIGDVYLPLSNDAVSGSCTFTDCDDCKLQRLCNSNDDAERLKIAFKLFPNLLTNFPELGV